MKLEYSLSGKNGLLAVSHVVEAAKPEGGNARSMLLLVWLNALAAFLKLMTATFKGVQVKYYTAMAGIYYGMYVLVSSM